MTPTPQNAQPPRDMSGRLRHNRQRVHADRANRALAAQIALAPDLKLGPFDAFVIAASVHQEHHQETVTNFVFAHHELLNTKPSALISVSLSAALEDQKTEAQKYVDRFVSVTGWQPRMTLLLGGALRFTKYDYFQEQFVKFVVMKSGYPSPERDHEFTDWNALANFADRFLETAG